MDPQANTPSDAKTNARRRLIRGSFAAPVALALHSGGVAARSNALRCAVNEQGTAASNNPDTSTWVKVRAYRLVKTVGGGNGPTVDSEWIKGNELVALLPPVANQVGGNPATSYLSAGQWQCVIDNTNQNRVGNIISSAPSRSNYVLDTSANGSYWTIRVNQYGSIVAVGSLNSTAGGSAVSLNCWASVTTI